MNLLGAYLANQDQVILKPVNGGFQLVSPATKWFTNIFGAQSETISINGVSVFLDHFLQDASQHWQTGSAEPLTSGPFIESLNGKQIPIEARALMIDDTPLLVLHKPGDAYDAQQQLLQVARDNLLNQEALEREVSKRTVEIRGRELEIAERLIYAAGFRDEETGTHILRIGHYSAVMAEALGWSPLAVDDIKIAAPMHDIGKIGIPDSILKKPGRLTVEEFSIMQNHTLIGQNMLTDSSVPMLQLAAEIAGAHHEHWNGAGYPHGLVGDDIPVSARIVAIVDVYDALVHKRVYKSAFDEREALTMMEKMVGNQFDPQLFDLFLQHLDQMREIREQLQDR